jgi:hypothetical protein
VELIRMRGGGNEKGHKKAEEFRRYLDGERSARDPRFDLKVFQYVPSFPPLLLTFPPLVPPCASCFPIGLSLIPSYLPRSHSFPYGYVGERY